MTDETLKHCAICNAQPVLWHLVLDLHELDTDEHGDLWEHHDTEENHGKALSFCANHKPDLDELVKHAAQVVGSASQRKVYTVEIHVKERADSTAEARLFDCWVAGDGADRLSYYAFAAYPEGLCNLHPALGSSKAIRYIAEVEKMAWLWSLEINKQHDTEMPQPTQLAEMHVTRVQELIF